MDDNVEMVLCTLGFKVLSMRSAHSAAVRDECVEAFTSTGNIEEVQMLCTSTRIASTAVNLQADRSDVVFLDIPNNAQTLPQAGARVHRMGQKYPCHLYILTVDGSYDQSAQANQALIGGLLWNGEVESEAARPIEWQNLTQVDRTLFGRVIPIIIDNGNRIRTRIERTDNTVVSSPDKPGSRIPHRSNATISVTGTPKLRG